MSETKASSQIAALLQKLVTERFWGKLEIEMRNGEITVLRKSETIKYYGEETNGNGRTR